MCLRRAPEKYIAGAALDRAGLDYRLTDGGEVFCLKCLPSSTPQKHYTTKYYEVRNRPMTYTIEEGRVRGEAISD
jgi:hypothetical protein